MLLLSELWAKSLASLLLQLDNNGNNFYSPAYPIDW